MKLNKKGISQSMMAGIILAMVVLVIMIYFANDFSSFDIFSEVQTKESLLAEGDKAFRDGHYEEAKKSYTKFVKLYEGDDDEIPRVQCRLAKAHARLDEDSQAQDKLTWTEDNNYACNIEVS